MTDENIAQPNQVAVCSNCRRKSSLADSLIERPVIGLKGITEIGLACRHCDHYLRIYWNGPKLDEGREMLNQLSTRLRAIDGRRDRILAEHIIAQYRQAKTDFDEQFIHFQKYVANRLGLKYESPTAKLTKVSRRRVIDLRRRQKSDPTDHLELKPIER